MLMIDLSHETVALARRVAAAQSVSVEEAIRQALEEWARAVPEPGWRDLSPEVLAERRAKMDQIVADIAAMPILDPRSPHEIIDDLNAL